MAYATKLGLEKNLTSPVMLACLLACLYEPSSPHSKNTPTNRVSISYNSIISKIYYGGEIPGGCYV